MNSEVNGLIIKKGGKLFESKWSTKSKKRIQKNITNQAIHHLFDNCRIDDDVTLKDILLLIKGDLKFYQIILRNWVDEIVEEGLSGKKPDKKDEFISNIQYLELYYHPEINHWGKGKPLFETGNFPMFHGIGYEKKKKTQFAVEFTPVYELIHLPVKLKNRISVYDNRIVHPKKKPINIKYKPEEFEYETYSLGGILYGIIWELSFCGSPKDRDTKKDEIFGMMDDIKDGKVKTVKFKNVKDFIKGLNK